MTADAFDQFWAAYPRKVAKGQARKAWAQLKPDAALLERMLLALAWQKLQPNWKKDGGQFIPHAASWLRGERWDDEPFNTVELGTRPVTSGIRVIH